MTGIDFQKLEKPDRFSLALNVWPFAHIAAGLLLSAALHGSPLSRVLLFAAWIYLLPPLLGRLLILLFGVPSGSFTQDERPYRVWWMLTQLQTVFNRLPFLEELLRLAPGLYALWISLWGGRVSPFAYIGPGVIITDRYSTVVGRGAVLGYGCALAGHFATRQDDGRWLVVAAGPVVEPEAIVGGAAGLGPGAVLKAGAVLPAGMRIKPFGCWPREDKA
jgi:hypothetical protein